MQNQLVAGETFNYQAEVADYPATDGWVLTLYLNPRSGGTNINVTSTASGTAHLLQQPGTTTAAWAPGTYGWEIWAAKGAERYRIEAGQLEVLASLISAPAGTDTRSDAERALDLLRKAWTDYVSSGNFKVGAYSVLGRSFTYRSVEELRSALNACQRDVDAERRARDIAAGLGGRERFVVRM